MSISFMSLLDRTAMTFLVVLAGAPMLAIAAGGAFL